MVERAWNLDLVISRTIGEPTTQVCDANYMGADEASVTNGRKVFALYRSLDLRHCQE